jgi:hypothetical protein
MSSEERKNAWRDRNIRENLSGSNRCLDFKLGTMSPSEDSVSSRAHDCRKLAPISRDIVIKFFSRPRISSSTVLPIPLITDVSLAKELGRLLYRGMGGDREAM